MKKNMKKILAGSLALLMILAMLPTFAFADVEVPEASPAVTDSAEQAGDGSGILPDDSNTGNSDGSDFGIFSDGPAPDLNIGAETYGFPGVPDIDLSGGIDKITGYADYVFVAHEDVAELVTRAIIVKVVEVNGDQRTELNSGFYLIGQGVNQTKVWLLDSQKDKYKIVGVEGSQIGELLPVPAPVITDTTAEFYFSPLKVPYPILTVLLQAKDGGDVPVVPDNKLTLSYMSTPDSEGVPAAESKEPVNGKADFTVAAAPTREGYDFISWSDGSAYYAPGTPITIESDTTLIALWKEKDDTTDPDNPGTDPDDKEKKVLTFDDNGGEGGPGSKEYVKNFPVALGLVKPEPSHVNIGEDKVVFIGWSDTQYPVLKNGDKKEFPKEFVIMDSDKTVYAMWGLDTNGNGLPDVYEDWTFTLYYDVTIGDEGTGPAPKTGCLPKSVVELDYETIPTSGVSNVIFMYWTDFKNHLKYGDKIFGDGYTQGEEALPDKINSVEMLTNTKVYAVWSYDNNGDEIPDAFQKDVPLKYDPNGGKGGPVDELVVTKTTVTLKQEPKPTHDNVDEKKVLFAGWTTEADPKIYTDKDELPANCVTKLVIPADSTGETVYALWGFDEDGSGVPDVLELTLTYDANGGKGGPGKVNVGKQKDYVLETENLPTHGKIITTDVLFMGWSLIPCKPLEKDDVMPAMVEKIDIEKDMTVYAVWGLDKNGNNVPDIEETDRYTLSFDVNGGMDKVVPAAKTGLLEGETVNLKLAALPMPIHEMVDNTLVVLVGWTDEAYPSIFDKEDPLPDDLHKDGTLVMPAEDKTVYALWGYDRNKDGIPDILQEMVTLTYNPNGGAGGPGVVDVPDMTFQDVDMENMPVHDDIDGVKVVCFGYTKEADEKIYDLVAGDEKPDTEKAIFIKGNTELFAVYGLDRDGNGKADVDEYDFVLSYDANGGEHAPAPQFAAKEKDGYGHFIVSSEIPTRKGMEFKGWAPTAEAKVPVYASGAPVKLNKNATLYAVWGTPGSGGGGSFPGFGGGSGKPGAPKTGDESNIALWAGLAVLSVIGMGTAVVIGKKHGKKN